jgi:cation diffusion facilitator CzcD-associated flavoprotein CzcO
LVTFIREATWISPPIGQEYHAYTSEEKQRFKEYGQHHLDERKGHENRMNSGFGIFHSKSEAQKNIRQHMLRQMKEKLQNPELEKVLVPDWSVGCRRLTPGTNYLESLSDSNVKVVYGEITQATETGVICDNGAEEYSVDVLICATGFDTTFKPRFPLVNALGEDLRDLWKSMLLGFLAKLATVQS